ncbi:MAG: hypothetical protein HY895_17375 [Deltaproteobacteria bacterium]|nr:hypothetical protein [Deltaproteobacteria bacterium]
MNTSASNSNTPSSQGASLGNHRRWTVLFIGDHGRVIAFKRVKILLALAGAAFLLSLTAVGVLAVVNQTLHRRNTELQQGLEASGQAIRDLRHDRDLLTAQVVLVETKMRETLAGVNRSPAAVPGPFPAGAADKAPPKPLPGRPGEASVSGISPTPSSDSAAERVPVGTGEGIAAEDLGIRYHRASNTLELQYKIVNTSPGRKPLNGHAVAVLKGSRIDPKDWTAMPAVGLTNGRPSGHKPGYRFSISHSKAFTQTVRAPRNLLAYDAAVLYVFSNEGELLTAREFSVDISSSAPE